MNTDQTQAEFPDYPVDALPALPDDFEDVSWHNDSCPSFFSKARGVVVHIDYPEREAREIPDSDRFTLFLADEHGSFLEDVLWSDDWEAIKAEIDKRG